MKHHGKVTPFLSWILPIWKSKQLSPLLVISTQNHKSNHCNRHCTYYNVPDDVAIIIHYRNSCKGNNKNEACKPSNSVKDTEIWKYKDELINRTTNVLKRLKLI